MIAWRRLRRRKLAVAAVLTVSPTALLLAAFSSFSGFLISSELIVASGPPPKGSHVRIFALHAFAVPILLIPVLGGLGWIHARLFRRAGSSEPGAGPTDRE
jgi:hypothetical protein